MKQSGTTVGHSQASSDQRLVCCLQLWFAFFYFFFAPFCSPSIRPKFGVSPCSQYANSKAHICSVPSSCDTGLFSWGWAELDVTLLPSYVHLSECYSPHCEPMLLFPSHTNVCVGKARWQMGQRVASSVHSGLPPPSSEKHSALRSGWAGLDITCGVPFLGTRILVFICTRMDSKWSQLNGSVANILLFVSFFPMCGRIT